MRITKKQRQIVRRTAAAVAAISLISAATIYVSSRQYLVLDAQGTIASQQRNLLIFATLLSLVIIVPVFALTYHIVRTYRIDSKRPAKKRQYRPDWSSDTKLETIWWVGPSVLILILSIVTWNSSHSLDPYKPIAATGANQQLDVQVIALQWNWLFIYPEQGVASLNTLYIPEDTPLSFSITSDAPMNSFWIPQLGGQVYAMSGMVTKLHLMADNPGSYRGQSANLSGQGHAKMDFTVESLTTDAFKNWAGRAATSESNLSATEYGSLRQPKADRQPATYRLQPGDNIFASTVAAYAHEDSHADNTHLDSGDASHDTN